jgi:hypothetical protein
MGKESGKRPRRPGTPDPPEDFYEGDPSWPAVTTCYGQTALHLARGCLDANDIDHRETIVDCGVQGSVGVVSEPRTTLYVRRHQYNEAKKFLDPDSFLEDWEFVGGDRPDQAESTTEPGDAPDERPILGLRRDFFEMVIVIVLIGVLTGLALTTDFF